MSALARVRALVEQTERVVAAADWGALAGLTPVLDGTIEPEELAEAHALVGRLEEVLSRIAGARDATRAQLDELGTLRTASRAYLRAGLGDPSLH